MTTRTILFLAANPLGTSELALGREARAIHETLERSGAHEFELVTRWAVQPTDLFDELRRLEPVVVHISGHGARRDPVVDREPMHGLFLEDPDGRPRFVSVAALQEIIGAAGASVKLVVLNADYSDMLAESLLAHVDCAVGYAGSLRDDAARSFATGFYRGLADNQSVAACHRLGCATLRLEGLQDRDMPRLLVREGVDARRLSLVDRLAEPAATSEPGASSRPTKQTAGFGTGRRPDQQPLKRAAVDELSDPQSGGDPRAT